MVGLSISCRRGQPGSFENFNFLFGIEPKRVQLDNSKIVVYIHGLPEIRKIRRYSNALQIVTRRRIKITKEP